MKIKLVVGTLVTTTDPQVQEFRTREQIVEAYGEPIGMPFPNLSYMAIAALEEGSKPLHAVKVKR